MTEVFGDKKLSRRQFVGTAAAGAAVLSAGAVLSPKLAGAAVPAKPAAVVPKVAGPVPIPASWDAVADVIVVGLGGAGGAAALNASAAGATVLVLEKLATPGGCTALAHGSFAAAGSTYEKALGLVDSPGKMFDFWTRAGMGVTDPEVLLTYCVNAADAWLWLANTIDSQIGVTNPLTVWGSSSFTGSPYVTASDVVPRMPYFLGYTPAGYTSSGAGTFRGVYSAVQKDPNIQVMLSTPAVGLVTNNGEVVGVQAVANDTLSYFKANRAVVLTTGDIGRNDEMTVKYAPFTYYAFKITAPGCTGDGVRLGQQVGADLAGLGGCMSHPRTTEPPPGSIELSGGSLATDGSASAANGELSATNIIFVNNSGLRFVNESTQYVPTSQLVAPYIPSSWGSYYAGLQIFGQEKMQAWAIFDNQVASKGGNTIVTYWSKDLSTEIAGGYVVQANTISGLATALGIDPTTLTNTINQWNTNAANNVDPVYQRPAAFMQINTPPYFAAGLNWTCDQAFGGLKINGNTQVLDTFGNPIPHLYAAGSTTGGIMGRFYQESGGAFGSAFTMGRIAGKKAAAEIPWS
jgi:succinate dehydrogenase/fumarate reductase flavoprotein subunit